MHPTLLTITERIRRRSHNTRQTYLDKCRRGRAQGATRHQIVPGLLIGALSFGHLPTLFVPAGPMPSGLSNKEKVQLRQDYVAGIVGADVLMDVETRSYHSPGTCTFYGTANSNQMLLECMGLMLPGIAFVNPDTPLRAALTQAAARQITTMTSLTPGYRPLCDIVDERTIVNAGLIGAAAATLAQA